MAAGKGLRIGVIGGAGWLGGAIAAAVLDAGIATPRNLALSYRSERPDRFPDSLWTTDNQALADHSDIIVLSVRPADWPGSTVQFLAALPDTPPALRPMPPMLEFEQTPNPLRDLLAREPIEQRRGIVRVPDGPGLGIEIDREILHRYKVA